MQLMTTHAPLADNLMPPSDGWSQRLTFPSTMLQQKSFMYSASLEVTMPPGGQKLQEKLSGKLFCIFSASSWDTPAPRLCPVRMKPQPCRWKGTSVTSVSFQGLVRGDLRVA